MLYTVNCAILGTKDIFSVEIDSNAQVSKLKTQIRDQEIRKLEPFAPSDLRLYKLETFVSDSDYDTLNNLELKEEQRLRRSVSRLSTVFGATGPLEETLHIVVDYPRGESISSS